MGMPVRRDPGPEAGRSYCVRSLRPMNRARRRFVLSERHLAPCRDGVVKREARRYRRYAGPAFARVVPA